MYCDMLFDTPNVLPCCPVTTAKPITHWLSLLKVLWLAIALLHWKTVTKCYIGCLALVYIGVWLKQVYGNTEPCYAFL